MAQDPTDGCKALYVGNLDSRVNEEILTQIFAAISDVDNVKIIHDRYATHGSMNYGFVEFQDHQGAEIALQSMAGRKVFGQDIRVNWATQGSTQKEDTSSHYHIFVGDLSPEVNDSVLTKAFSPFRSTSEARVMWDQTTGKSRGFGFVAFRDKADAEQAIATMNGEWLGSRAIRCNWANQKTSGQPGNPTAGPPATTVDRQFATSANMSYEQIFAQTPHYQTTVYIGNLPHGITQQDIAPYFQQYGYVTDIRLQSDRGYAFVKMDSHANAATSIFALQGFAIGGRPAKLSWGKDRTAANNNTQQYDPYSYNYANTSYAQQNWVQPTGNAYDVQAMRPPAQVAGPHSTPGPEAGGQNWDQYYQNYYSAGHNMNA
ncbi:hypothetical protein CLU79DRAFT_750900 [Phycomyces nitens]|nr:hypothetical protein CLU79DRAFT_750900 [Phycomyces nitens]